MNFDKILVVLKMIPAITAAVQSIEAMLPISGAGKAKLKIVEETVTDLYSEATTVWPYTEKFISRLVAVANEFGVFKK